MDNYSDLQFHPDAIFVFNEEAEKLLSQLQVAPPEIHERPSSEFQTDEYIHARISEEDVILKGTSLVTHWGQEIGKFFDYNNTEIGLYGQNYKNLENLSVKIAKAGRAGDILSTEFIKNSIFDWIKKRHIGQATNSIVDFLSDEARDSVRQFEKWIPISATFIEAPFTFGGVQFRVITQQMINKSEESWIIRNPQHTDSFNQCAQRLRENLQGLAAGVVSVTAEAQKAGEIAFEKVENAISVLRCFFPFNLFPQALSFSSPLAVNKMPSITLLNVENEIIESEKDQAIYRGVPIFRISKIMLEAFREAGLEAASELLTMGKLSDFQGDLLRSVLLYSRNSLEANISHKLIYILVSLESLLLKNQTEPIQQNVSERMAFLLGFDLQTREEIIRVVKDTYGLRSSYLHHGKLIPLSELEILERFMNYAFLFIHKAIEGHHLFPSKEDFIKAIDQKKLRGGL